VKVTYDKKSGTAYIYLLLGDETTVHGGVRSTVEAVPGVHLDFDHANHLVGLEIMDAMRVIPALLSEEIHPAGPMLARNPLKPPVNAGAWPLVSAMNHVNYKMRKDIFDRWIIIHADNPNIGWSGSRWVYVGGATQLANFDNEEEGRAYALKMGLKRADAVGA
jgi:uncharacterized protein YuzE